MRILAIDYGRKRVGLALSDPLGLTAQPAGFLLRSAALVDDLAKLVAEKEVSEIVVGYPTSLNGQPNEMTREIDKFVERLRSRLPLPVHLQDERLTTAQAEKLLIGGDVRREKRKEVRDQIAAALILQGYLARRGSPPV